MSNISVLGSGQVGQALADGFLKHGHEVMRASREPQKLEEWKTRAGAKAQVGTLAEAAVEQAGARNLAGKTVMDATNPIADAAPQNGVLRFFTDLNESLMERLQ